jgi:hypothetical protein
VAEWSTLRAAGDELARLKRQPGSAIGVNLSATFLKHSDEQTVLGLATVLKAMSRRNRPAETYRNWGLVVGPKMFGRDSMAWVVQRFFTEGAWGVPPYIIPHGILHADSGTISQALALHGPNISVSGGPNACGEAMLIAASMLMDNSLPGLWLVLSAFGAEKIPDDPAFADLPCEAVALALTVVRGQESGGRGQESWGSENNDKPTSVPTLRIDLGDEVPTGLTELTVPSFRAVVDAEGAGRWRLPEGGWVEFVGTANSREGA